MKQESPRTCENEVQAKPELNCITASLVTYGNSPQEIGDLLQSVRASESVRQVVVIDNSSCESLRSCVESYGAEYIRMNRNVGFGAGHNFAIKKHCRPAKYHLVVNPDISCDPEVLDSLYRFMEEHPDVGLVMPRILYPDGSEQRLCKQLPSPLDLFVRRFLGSSLFKAQRARYELRHLDMDKPREVPCLSGCFMLLRSSALREIGGFDERYFMYMEDFDLCRRIAAKYKTVYYPEVSVTHGYAKGSYRNPKLLAYHLRSSFRYFGKWGWILDSERKKLNRKTSLLLSEQQGLDDSALTECRGRES
ncbi:glycosyltransferase family 2 protein [Acidobacterium sp. S8]|uniref:glycosyltransferase family 2 protein n=1 Tax=Acidobacterium sp. S8 TaxID=1641854 RepID=UPI001C2076D9|nr:glycosyltransferase family 2 protein [Acidobacterium sp. S8]